MKKASGFQDAPGQIVSRRVTRSPDDGKLVEYVCVTETPARLWARQLKEAQGIEVRIESRS